MFIYQYINKRLVILSVLLSFNTYAEQQGDIYRQHVADAQALATLPVNAINAHDYCTGAHCEQIEAPTASQYYDDNDAIKGAATTAITTNPYAQATEHAAPHRPKINSNDPAYINAQHDMSDAYE
ncbi:hypothetical protein C9J21_22455, partial [Photobacterium phosphoreum]|uniref:hypothetical protein n=1 Tax=Photobacterium phosphoreum TaxID=659 RepID=UPI000D4D9CD7